MKVQRNQHSISSSSILLLILWTGIAPPPPPVNCSDISNCSTLRPAVERIFSRKKRFLLLPPGGSIKFTVNVGKRLLAKYPRGFNHAFEAATYYEAFTKRIDLIPKFLRKPTTTTPKPVGPTKPIYVYIPGTEIRYKAKPAKKPTKVQRIDDEDLAPLQWVDASTVNKYAQKYADPKQWLKYSKYGDVDYQQKYAWTRAKQWHDNAYQTKSNAKWTHWTTTARPAQQQWWQPRQWNDSFVETPNFYDAPSLHHYHGHRDRRQLYATFEAFGSVLGFDVKACVLRAICDCQRLFMPTGYSMLQDMMRAILTMPIHQSISDDEYSHAMGVDADTCKRDYQQKCPISIINWVMNPQKTITN